MYLMCEGERVEDKTFKYAFDFTDQQYNKLMNARAEKGFFKYKGLHYEIVIDKPKVLKSGKQKAAKIKVTNKVMFNKSLYGLTCKTVYFLEGEEIPLNQIEAKVHATPQTIRYNTKNCKSVTLNGCNITIKRYIIDFITVYNKMTKQTKKYKSVEEISKELCVGEGAIYNVLSNNCLLSKKYKIKRIYKEIKDVK